MVAPAPPPAPEKVSAINFYDRRYDHPITLAYGCRVGQLQS
nr:MAG TPA: hypothetical protein [Caudoviricetes sp.]